MQILLVDNRFDSSTIIGDWLREFFGAVSLESAASSAEALSAMPGTRPELVLATHRMPGLNGIALARVIKAGPNPPAVTVIGTGSDADFGMQCAAAGADFWLQERELQARLLAFLQQRFARVWAEGVRERERLARWMPATLAARAPFLSYRARILTSTRCSRRSSTRSMTCSRLPLSSRTTAMR